MLEVRERKKGVSLKEHGFKIREETHSKVKYLSGGRWVGLVVIVWAKQITKRERSFSTFMLIGCR